MDSTVHVHVYSLIFPSLQRNVNIEPGASIADILRHIGIPESASPYIYLSFQGFAVHSDQWRGIRPKGGTHLQVGIAPANDGGTRGKDQLREAAFLANVVGSYLVPGLFGLSGLSAGVLQMALTAAGSWAITTFMPYRREIAANTNTLTSARNQAKQYGSIPTVHGHMRIAPPLAAAPITEIKGEDHYIRLLLCLGYKPLKADRSTINIGENPLKNFQGVVTQVNDGWDNLEEITLFSGDVEEEFMDRRIRYAEVWRYSLTGVPIPPESTSEFTLAPGVVTMTTPSNTIEIGIDLTFPDGIGRKNGDGLSEHQIGLQLQYRPANSILETSWVTHIPQGENLRQIIYAEVEHIARGVCVAWLVELTAMIGDLIDAAEFASEPEGRNTPKSVYDAVFKVASDVRLLINSRSAATDYISGELSTWDSLRFQATRLLELCASVLRVSDEEDLVYSKEFVSAFEALTIPTTAAKEVLGVRLEMGNLDAVPAYSAQLSDLVRISQSLPTIFEVYPTETFELKPAEARAGIVRRNISFRVPEGKWEVRLRKTTPDHDDDETYLDKVNISVFRCRRAAPAISDYMRENLALMAIEVLATDQLTGSLDQLSLEVERPVHYTTDGATWQGPAIYDSNANRVSRNPAWIMADILTQTPATRAVGFERIDGNNLLSFAEFCNDNVLHFDRQFDQRGTVHRALQDVCAVAKASPTIRDGRYAAIWDRPQGIARAVISMANATDFEASKVMASRPQALRIRFKNPAKDWADDELHIYDDGFGESGKLIDWNEVARAESATSIKMSALYGDIRRIYDIGGAVELNVSNYRIMTNTAGTKTVIVPRSSGHNFTEGGNYNIRGHIVTKTPTRVEEVSLPGLVDVPGDPTHEYHSNQVYKLGRYLLAVAKLRPETFKARLDFENLVFERGDRVEVQMDTVLWGLGSSRIRSLTRVIGGPNNGKVATITTEQDLFLNDGDTYAVRIRNSRNGISGETTFDFDETQPNTIILDIPMNDASVPLIKGDLVAWGVPSKSTISCLVQEIRPQRDMSAEVTLIQYSPGVYEAENGPIPEFDPGITIPPNPERQAPPAPAIVAVTTDESVLERDTDGSYASRIVIDLRLPQGSTRAERDAASRVDAIHVQYRRSLTAPTLYEPEWIRSGVYARDTTRVSVRDVEDGIYYDVRIRAVTRDGVPSIWSEIPSVLVLGKLTPPPDVENLQWLDDKLVWEYPNPPFDHAGYLVRYVQGKGGKWEDAVPAHAGRLMVSQFPTEFSYEADRAYLVKAVDTSGVESTNAKQVTRFGANVPGVFEVLRVTGLLESGAFTLVGDTYEMNANADPQGSEPFYKGRATDPAYPGASEPFYQRTYPSVLLSIGYGSWVAGIPAGPTARWLPTTKLIQTPPYVVKGIMFGLPLWPESLTEDLWPSSLSESYWPEYMHLSPLRPKGLPHIADIEAPEGEIAWILADIPASNIQTKFKDFGAALVVPLRIERVHDFECTTTTPGTGDTVPLESEFINIVSVQATLRDDEPGGSVRIVKTSTTVEVFIYDATGVRTAGFVDLTIEGY